MKNQFKKVLVAAPTASAKNYCAQQYIENCMKFTYPNFNIKLFDNTFNDSGSNAFYLNKVFKNLYGQNNDKFEAVNSMQLNRLPTNEIKSVIERMCLSHNDCRNEVLRKAYDFLLHCESDIFPQEDIIEQLMSHNKPVVGALYYRDEGKWRKPMLQRHIYNSPNTIVVENFTCEDDNAFVDGTLKKVASVGLGCVLIKREVLEKIEFRFEKGVNMHPDSYFSEDCFRNKIPVFCDTNCIAEHQNKQWGVYGKDFN